jgi:Protein of unknown function (DUF1453)
VTEPAAPFIFGGLIAWGVYRRVRRSIGKQKLRPVGIIIRLCIFALFSAFIVIAGVMLNNTAILLAFAGGLLTGGGLGLISLRLTRFETTDEGHFYTPNTHIGVALSALLVFRMIYRMYFSGSMGTPTANHPPMPTPLTCFIIGLTIGYYIVYYIGLFVHTHDRKPDGSGVQNL